MKNYFKIGLSTKCLPLMVCFLSIHSAYAQLDHSFGSANLAWDECAHTLEVKNIKMDAEVGLDDQVREVVKLAYKNSSGSFVEYFNLEYQGSGSTTFNSTITGCTDDEYATSSTNVTVDYDEANRLLSVTYTGIPENLMGTELEVRYQTKVKLLGAGCEVAIIANQPNAAPYNKGAESESIEGIDLFTINPPTSFTATDNVNCSSIMLSWGMATEPSDCLSDVQYQIERRVKNTGSYVLIHTASQSTEEYEDSDINLSRDEIYEYRIRSKFSPKSSINNYSSFENDEGSLLEFLDPMVLAAASTDNCDGKIVVTWNTGILDPNITKLLFYTRAGSSGTFVPNGSIDDPSIGSYDDFFALSKETNIEFKAVARDICGNETEFSNVVTGRRNGTPNEPDMLSAVLASNGITINWSISGPFHAESGFIIERSFSGGGLPLIIDIDDKNQRSYEDTDILQCITYTYKVRAKSLCFPDGIGENTISGIVGPDLSSTFATDGSGFRASKGIYTNKVELSWTNNNASQTNVIKLFRRFLNSTDDFILLATENGGGIYNDNDAESGVLYEYKIRAEGPCENDISMSNEVTTIGFRSKSGIVNGQVTYTGGIAVEDVKIIAEGQLAGGSSIHVDGGEIVISDKDNQDLSSDMLLETWIKPSDHSLDQGIIEKDGVYKLSFDQATGTYISEIVFNLNTYSIAVSKDSILLNQWTHIATQIREDSLCIYINGKPVGKTPISTIGSFISSSNDIEIGKQWKGHMKEVRIWGASKSDKEMLQDHARYMTGSEMALIALLPMNEKTGDFVYDRSRTGPSIFNQNHGLLTGTSWSSDIPTLAQLSHAAYTNASGHYSLNLPYANAGENYSLTPKFQTHEFIPSSTVLFVGDGSSVLNGIDFLDDSSFPFTGSLFYKGTTCPVEGAFLKVDGINVLSGGQAVVTDPDGNFSIQVPIGDHFVSVEKPRHVFSAGRFPPSGLHDFQAPLPPVAFKDSTTVKVVGRVVGGLRETTRPIGFNKSINNIGQARLIFEAQKGGGCIRDTVFTDVNSGEYSVDLPPLKYISKVSMVSPSSITFDLEVLNYDETALDRKSTDTTFDQNGNVFSIDSVLYNFQHDRVYRTDPIISVRDRSGKNFIGDTVLIYAHPNGEVIERNLRTDPLPWPVFKEDEPDPYRCAIQVFELYQNLDNGAMDSVPTTDGTLFLNNQIADTSQWNIELDKINTVDSLKYLHYSFRTGVSNFNINTNTPKYSFTNTFSLWYISSDNKIVNWLPDFLPSIESTDPTKVFRGYILGSRSTGTRFFTNGPETPEFILRDPPGSESSASRAIGSSTSFDRSWSWSLGSGAHTEDKISAGAKFLTGIGVAVENQVKTDVTTGFEVELGFSRSGSVSETTTSTTEWSTNDGTDQVGTGSDLYFGKSQNMEFGITENLRIIPDSICYKVECIGSSFNGFSFAKTYGLALSSEGYATHFIYSQSFILNYLIPDLEEVKKALLTGPKYTSHLPIDDPNYGLSNDDEKLTNPVDCGESDPCFETLTGESYTFHAINLSDSLYRGDSVQFINKQIDLWQEAISLNEWEKTIVGDETLIDSIRDAQLDALAAEYAPSIVAQIATGVVSLAALGTITYGIIAVPVQELP